MVPDAIYLVSALLSPVDAFLVPYIIRVVDASFPHVGVYLVPAVIYLVSALFSPVDVFLVPHGSYLVDASFSPVDVFLAPCTTSLGLTCECICGILFSLPGLCRGLTCGCVSVGTLCCLPGFVSFFPVIRCELISLVSLFNCLLFRLCRCVWS